MPDSLNTPNDLRSQKVDMLSTKNNDLKQRRVVNAAPAVDRNDYVILDQLNQAVNEVEGEITALTTTVTQVAIGVILNRAKYGTHAFRLSLNPSSMDTVLFVETDRDNVIYQSQNGRWAYVAGTMWNTISPDMRPTDLGLSDTKFNYRTTDSPAREFFWSGSVWVEATPVRFGLHSSRLALTIANIIEQMLWMETDRGNVIYQVQGAAWVYISGMMRGTQSPDLRPTDLGTTDIGFLYFATDTSYTYRWAGSVWTIENNFGNINVNNQVLIGGVQVLTNRQAGVTAPSGGTVIDVQSRTAINDIVTRLRNMGIIS